MSAITQCKIGALRTGEFAAETALNVGVLGFEGVRITGVGVKKVGEAMEDFGLLGSTLTRAQIEQINRETDRMIREIKAMALEAEVKRRAAGGEATGQGGEPEVVLV